MKPRPTSIGFTYHELPPEVREKTSNHCVDVATFFLSPCGRFYRQFDDDGSWHVFVPGAGWRRLEEAG